MNHFKVLQTNRNTLLRKLPHICIKFLLVWNWYIFINPNPFTWGMLNIWLECITAFLFAITWSTPRSCIYNFTNSVILHNRIVLYPCLASLYDPEGVKLCRAYLRSSSAGTCCVLLACWTFPKIQGWEQKCIPTEARKGVWNSSNCFFFHKMFSLYCKSIPCFPVLFNS